jgi:transcriptional regulator with XRE-family HTH domain
MISRTHNARTILGQRVRALRKEQNKTLLDLGAIAGLSKSTLSKIENGTLSVSYDNLLKLAEALAIDVSALFSDKSAGTPVVSNGRRSVTRRNTGEIYENDKYLYEILCADLSPRKMFPIVTTVRAHSISSARDLIRHSGEEFIYVLEGKIEVHCEFYSPISLDPGDGLYFDSAMGHAIRSVGDRDAKILWMATSALSAIPSKVAKKAAARKTSR